jgi:hypothetical protein
VDQTTKKLKDPYEITNISEEEKETIKRFSSFN